MTSTALCNLCQKGRPNPQCPACHDLREKQRLLATPHDARDLAKPSTFMVVQKPGAIVLQRKNDPFLAIVLIPMGLFMIGLMGFIFAESGIETLFFVIPLVVLSLVGFGFAIRSLMYRQLISLERGVLTVTESPSSKKKGPITAREIEQLVIAATHATYWHKGLRWHTRFDLHAHTRSGTVLVFSGGLEEVRFVEAAFEPALGIDDDASRNTVTVAGH